MTPQIFIYPLFESSMILVFSFKWNNIELDPTRAIRAVAGDAESCPRCCEAAVAERLQEAAANLHAVSSAAVMTSKMTRSARSELDLLRCESEENINGGGKVHSTVVYGELRCFDFVL